MITAICGGVGGSKLALGLYRALPPDTLSVIVNTADDLEFCGLHVSPDLDTVMYTLGGLSREDVGWGIEGDTFQALDMLAQYGMPTWFAVGDRDLATDVFRTQGLRSGQSLTHVTATMSAQLGVSARLLPMTDDRIATRLSVNGEWLDFQDYFVRRRHNVPVDAFRYDGVDSARPTPVVLQALESADAIVVVNSNPILSIMPFLSLPGVRQAIAAAPSPCVAVSPIVDTGAVSGPAADLMRLVDQPPTSTGVAHLYRGVADGIVIHEQDRDQVPAIEALGMRVLCVNTIMRTVEDRDRLAHSVLAFARDLR